MFEGLLLLLDLQRANLLLGLAYFAPGILFCDLFTSIDYLEYVIRPIVLADVVESGIINFY